MLNRITETLTAEKLQDIYTDEKFRNDVAFAHGYCKANGELIGRKTCSYPVEYIVTDEQIAEAEAERQRVKKEMREMLKGVTGKLVFVGMGMTHEPRFEDDVCNYRIRCEFQNPTGRRFFLELGSSSSAEGYRVNHAIDRTLQDELNDSFEHQGKFYNYKDLERRKSNSQFSLRFTKNNVRLFVNKFFDCHFKEVIIDNYNLSTEEYINISPPKAKQENA